MDLCLSMRPVSADEAAAMGLVDRIADDPDAEALELATRLVRLDGPTVARVKRLVTSDGLARGPPARTAGQHVDVVGEIPEGSLTAPSRDDA